MNLKLLFAAFALSSTTAFAQTSGIDKANMDMSVKPGDNFYQYAAGGWLKAHPLDAEHSMNGAFVDLEELNEKRIRELVEEYASKPQAKGSLAQKIGSLYNLFMDSVRLNREGYAPLKPLLKRIADIKTPREYQLVTAQLDLQGLNTTMFGIGADADLRNAEWNLVSINQGGLGLGTRDYYVKDDEQSVKVRKAYKDYLPPCSPSWATMMLRPQKRWKPSWPSKCALPKPATIR